MIILLRKISILLSVILFSCDNIIPPEKKVLTVAKLSGKPTFGKNGLKSYVYYFKGKEYFGTASFDAREFNYGDMFLIYIDNTNPHNVSEPTPNIKVNPIDTLNNCISSQIINIDSTDFWKVMEYQTVR